MDEPNDKCNWKKVFKKFLEPPKPVENENITRNNGEKSASVVSNLDQGKSISKTSLISCSPASNDSGYSGCKFESFNKLPSDAQNTLEPKLNFPEAFDCKSEINNELLFNPPPTHELNMNIHTTGYESEFCIKLPSEKFTSHQFNRNIPEATACKPEFNYKIPSKMISQEQNVDIVQARVVPETIKLDNFHSDKVPEWNKAFKSILRNNSSSMDVPPQKDIYHSKNTGNLKNSYPPGITSQRKQSSYKPRRRYEKYQDFEVSETEKKVKEIFALSRMFKFQQVNINDFHGCGVDLFKQDQSFSKSMSGSSKLTNKSYLPLTGFIAKSKPYTAADVAASYVPFDEDPWDDELLI